MEPFPGVDPGLPDRLLPRPWSGRAAAALFHTRHDRWVGPAWAWRDARTAADAGTEGV